SGANIHRFPDSKETDEWGVKPTKDFEVPMKDEERFAYVVYRRDRDIIHGKTGNPAPAKTKNGKDKDKKPFEDRVLKKALEYLQGEIKKADAGLVLPEVHVG